jgi:hypothetical protein
VARWSGWLGQLGSLAQDQRELFVAVDRLVVAYDEPRSLQVGLTKVQRKLTRFDASAKHVSREQQRLATRHDDPERTQTVT